LVEHSLLRDVGRKARDKSFALLLIGAATLLPPIAGVALIDEKILGLPIPLLYIFSVWAVLIIGAASLARPLRDRDVSTQVSDKPDAKDA
jgi:hypothetical protein